MKVKELKKLLETFNEELEVCVLKNGGHGCGDLPSPVKPQIKEVINYDGKLKKMVIVG